MKSSLAWSSALLLLLLLDSRTSTAVPCTSAQLAALPVVKDSEGVQGLAESVNCSGGSFDVEWVGSVIVEETIRLFGGTTLSITGAVDGTSVANGANMTSLFEVDGGTLHLSHLSLVGGTGERGGAIYATDALLTAASCILSNNTGVHGGGVYLDSTTFEFFNSSFNHNVASGAGGAMHMKASNVTVGERVLFESNEASSGGALYIAGRSIITLAGDNISFARNAATVYGGGAAYIDSSSVSIHGDVFLSANHASNNGGALYVSVSVVDIAGSTLWENNTAGDLGGCLASFQSTMIVQPSGNASFVDNAAIYSGGAAYLSNSTLLFNDGVVFARNVAGENGGAVYSDLSDITIAETAVWKDNSAENEGGGLSLWNSTLHVEHSGRAEYVGNTANSGGAVHSFNSRIVFDGDVVFGRNVAGDSGGGLFGDSSTVNVTGTALWEDNTSLNTGGGVAIWTSTMHIVAGGNLSISNNNATVGGGMFIGENAAVFITGWATFSHNAAETGAGIKMATFSSAKFTGGFVLIQGNTASSSGGGIHCESPTVLELDGVEFWSNYGGVNGGAMTTILAGTERVQEAEAEPAIISNCWFSDNTATDAGGALFIGGGFVDIRGSYFYDNVAGRSGGAILASGIVSLDYCVLTGNQAGVGAAVTNTVSVYFYYVDFINNTLLCDDSTHFLDWNHTSSLAAACESCSEECYNCTVENPNQVQECQPVLAHTTSLGANGSLETLSLQQGFWRSSTTSKEIRECYETSACVGGTEGYCSEGYQGPLCAVCEDGYTAGLGYTCSECSAERRSATIAVGAILGVALVAVVVRSLRLFGTDAWQSAAVDSVSNGGIDRGRPRRARASQALKVTVVSWQIVTQFSVVASVVYPDVYNTFLKYADMVNLNLGWMFSAGCLVDTDFYDNLLVSTLVPLVVVGLVATSHRVSSSRHSTSDRHARARSDHSHASALFWVSFLVYATVSSAIFQTFACVDFDNGKSYIRADHSLECYTPTHTWFRVYAGVMGVVYPFGIPFGYAVVLYRARAALKDTATPETSATDVTVLRELWVAYRAEVYFYEVVECVRRAVLSGVIVFIFPNTAGQIATAFLLALFFAAVFMLLDPYSSWFDTWAARTGHMIVLMSMFVALLQKVDVGQDDDFSQNVFGLVLVLANCAMIVAVAAEACGMCFVAVREVRQPVAPLRRRTPACSAQRVSGHTDLPAALTEGDEQAPF